MEEIKRARIPYSTVKKEFSISSKNVISNSKIKLSRLEKYLQ
jgi:hypothetical protein